MNVLSQDFWFTTFWGALYLSVLLALMVPALFFTRLRMLATSMLFLGVLDRISVAFLPDDMALAYLGFGYFLIAIVLVFFHPQIGKNLIVAFLLTIVSVALLAGSFDWIDWDLTGTIQEACGAIAMLTIIWPHRNGSRVSDGEGQVVASCNQHSAPTGVVAESEANGRAQKTGRGH